MEENEQESITIENIERPGEIIKEPVFKKTIRELKLGKKHTKEEIVQYFCMCGKSVSKENATRCSHCERLICKDCGILYINEVHCRKCLEVNHQISLTKADYMILLCVSHGIASAKTIFQLTGIKSDVVEKRVCDLMEKYVTKEPTGFLEKFFPKLRVTNLGRDALGVFDALYSKDADCISMKQKLSEFIAEKTRRTYSLRTQEDTTCLNQES